MPLLASVSTGLVSATGRSVALWDTDVVVAGVVSSWLGNASAGRGSASFPSIRHNTPPHFHLLPGAQGILHDSCYGGGNGKHRLAPFNVRQSLLCLHKRPILHAPVDERNQVVVDVFPRNNH